MEFAEAFRAAVESAMGGGNPSDYWRAHLGMSQIGSFCERKVFFDFRWFSKEDLVARKRRLLDRGHDEEHRFVRYLRKAGIRVFGRQTYYESSVPGFAGSIDGYIKFSAIKKHLRGHLLPPLPSTALVGLDFKTANNARFKAIEKNGVFAESPEYYAQSQSYMLASRRPESPTRPLSFFLFIFVNKDNDAWFFEMVPFHATYARSMLETAKEILAAKSPLELVRVAESPMWWQCKELCKNSGVCHFGEKPAKNCRTCNHSRNDGMLWTCQVDGTRLTAEKQRVGCHGYER